MDAEYFVFVGYCNQKSTPSFCEHEVAADPCYINECPCLVFELEEDAMVLMPDNA